MTLLCYIMTMPLGKEQREILSTKEEQIIHLRRKKGWGDGKIAELLGMSRQGVWKARQRYYERTGEKPIELRETVDKYENRMYNTDN